MLTINNLLSDENRALLDGTVKLCAAIVAQTVRELHGGLLRRSQARWWFLESDPDYVFGWPACHYLLCMRHHTGYNSVESLDATEAAQCILALPRDDALRIANRLYRDRGGNHRTNARNTVLAIIVDQPGCTTTDIGEAAGMGPTMAGRYARGLVHSGKARRVINERSGYNYYPAEAAE